MTTAHDVSHADRDIDTRLACYGTLAPGQVNHHQLSGLRGAWRPGTVSGKLLEVGWAAERGYPALVLNPLGNAVEVSLFESEDLPAHWVRLDDFEGPAYRRVIVPVQTLDGEAYAWVYVAAEP